MTCQNPLDIDVLVDYWAAALPPSEEEAVEEHLFTCDECGARLREHIALAEAIRELTRQASMFMVVSDSLLRSVAAEGFRVREYTPPVGGKVDCTVSVDDDFLIGRLTANLRGAKRVDLSVCDRQGREQMRLADIPFQSDAAGVAFHQSITYAKAAPSGAMVARLIGFDHVGGERLLGEYTFDHTRTIPGPAAW
jgi:hypothetical protein